MRESLHSVGWERVIVHFPGTIPLAHNKIAALSKFTSAVDKWLGFPEGRYLMDSAVAWLSSQ